MTKSLRDMTQKEVDFLWDEPQQKAFDALKSAVEDEEVTLQCDASQSGIAGCIRRMRDTLYWPRIAVNVREYVSKCEICLAHRDSLSKEPIMQHKFTARPR